MRTRSCEPQSIQRFCHGARYYFVPRPRLCLTLPPVHATTLAFSHSTTTLTLEIYRDRDKGFPHSIPRRVQHSPANCSLYLSDHCLFFRLLNCYSTLSTTLLSTSTSPTSASSPTRLPLGNNSVRRWVPTQNASVARSASAAVACSRRFPHLRAYWPYERAGSRWIYARSRNSFPRTTYFYIRTYIYNQHPSIPSASICTSIPIHNYYQ